MSGLLFWLIGGLAGLLLLFSFVPMTPDAMFGWLVGWAIFGGIAAARFERMGGGR